MKYTLREFITAKLIFADEEPQKGKLYGIYFREFDF